MENEQLSTTEAQACAKPPSPTSSDILGSTDQGQSLPTNNTLFPLRSLSLLPPPRMSSLTGAGLNREEPDHQDAEQAQRTSSLRPLRTSSFPGAGQYCEEPDQQELTVEQTQLSRDCYLPFDCATAKKSPGMFQKSKQKIAALLSPKQIPPRHPDHPNTPNNSPDYLFDERAFLTQIPGRKNKFWLTGGPPSQSSKGMAERRMLRRMSPCSRERRSVTAENGKKVAELEEEMVDMRDFQLEHDRAKEEREVEQIEREVEVVALEGEGEEADAQE